MRRLLFLLGLLSTTALAQQAVPPLGTAALVCAYNTSIPVPVAGTFAYVQCDANGKLITSGAGGGGITGPGTTTSGNLVTWNSTTGAAVADSGRAISDVPSFASTVLGNYSGIIRVTSATQYTGFVGNNGTNGTFSLQGTAANNDNGTLILSNTGTANVQLKASGSGYINNGSTFAIGATSGSYPLDVTGNIRTTTGLLINGSTVIDTIQSGNTSAQARTITFPNTGNATDTLALLAAGQTFSGANTLSGATTLSGTAQFSGAGPSSGPSANTTWVQGGSTAPTLGSNAGILAIGGAYAPPSLSTAGQGTISTSATYGLQLEGNPQVSFFNQAGTLLGYFNTNGINIRGAVINNTSGHAWDATAAPTTPVNAALTYQNGSGTIVFTATGGTTTISLTMPPASTRWVCKFQNETTLTSDVVQTPSASQTTTAIVLTNVARSTGTATNFSANDIVSGVCRGV